MRPGKGSTIVCIVALSAMSSFARAAEDLGALDCVIEPHMVVDLASRVDGIVQSIEVERGDVVTAEQILVKLDSGVEQAAVAAARMRASANAELKANNVSVEFATRRRNRLQTLYNEKAVSGDQMDEIATESDLTRLQLQQAEENRRIAQLELRQSIEVLNRHTLRSPVDGVVVQRYLSPGESTKDQAVMRIAQVDPLRVEVIVPVSAFGELETGQSAIVFPEAPKEGEYPATVTIVDKVADAASGTFRVRLSMPNPDYSLPSGLKCRVRFLPQDDTPDTQLAAPIPGPDISEPVGGNVVPVAQRMTADETKRQCRTIGPLANESVADRLAAALEPGVAKLNRRATTATTKSSFMILSERQESITGAKALAEKMQTAGIDDLFVFGPGPKEGFVSLGLYRDESEAKNRQHVIAEQGFAAEIRERGSRSAQYWLDVELAGDAARIALADEPEFAGVTIESVACTKTLTASD
ncbi:MAG: efflux RND transporter periplasmic adaptor subunit [Gammaproteobacteria bacterium]